MKIFITNGYDDCPGATVASRKARKLCKSHLGPVLLKAAVIQEVPHSNS
jgi:hypothetical protein